MSLIINTNIASLNAQNNLSKSQSALSTATQRLSSGLKINSAADNAAGYAISTRYTTQIGGLSQASANASDAINLAQTAGSALSQVTANLQAIRDLAVQSANGTYTASDRGSMDQEVQQRLAEITRIANQTTFNGSNVLDGSMGTKSFQIGANVGQTISVNLSTNVKSSAMGAVAEVSTGNISAAFPGTPAAWGAEGLKINGTAINTTGVQTLQDLSDAINAAGVQGVSAAVNGAGNGLNFYSTGALTIADTGTKVITAAAQDVNAGAAYTAGGTAATGGTLGAGNVQSVDSANDLISRVDVALKTVSDFSAQLGALQNRFQSTISTVAAQTTNLKSSQSTIQDADFAAETASLSRAQVLQQAGISVLAQANSNPQQVLKLLQ